MSTRIKPGPVASRANKKMMNPLKPMLAFLLLFIGYYLGLQHAVVMQGIDRDLHGAPHPSSVQKRMPSTLSSKSSQKSMDKHSTQQEDPRIFQLHQQIQLSEDPDLYRNTVNPLVEKLVKQGEVPSCSPEPMKPYFDILNNIEKNPMFYEDGHVKNTEQSCPVVFLFYFEGGTKLADNFFNFYGNISNKRCLNFIVNIRWKDSNETKEIVEKHGFTIVGDSYPKQDKTISMSLHKIKKQYGEDVLVSVNDLDHLLVWFDREGKPHRYSSYTDMVKLYVYELLTTKGCSDQNVHEKYVIPCTCLMQKNEKYVSTINDGIVWSEYGMTNRFHPTANFYLNRTLETKAEKRKSEYAYSIGTVFANLRKYEGDMITHHKIGWRTKKVFSRAKMCGVIHARSDNTIQSLAKYQHFLRESQHNVFRDGKMTIADAMGCSVVDTHGIIENEATCRKVKEFANILSIGHQKLACLNAGYSEEHCMTDISCCLTY